MSGYWRGVGLGVGLLWLPGEEALLGLGLLGLLDLLLLRLLVRGGVRMGRLCGHGGVAVPCGKAREGRRRSERNYKIKGRNEKDG